MKKKVLFCLLVIVFTLCYITPIYANSSWHWLTNSPLTMLPIAVIATLLIETVVIVVINKVRFPASIGAFIVIMLANIFSFIIPYAMIGLNEQRFSSLDFFESINDYVSHMPLYLIGPGFFLLTLFVELPIVFYYLTTKLKVSNKKLLMASIIAANLITIVIVYLIEHALFIGEYV